MLCVSSPGLPAFWLIPVRAGHMHYKVLLHNVWPASYMHCIPSASKCSQDLKSRQIHIVSSFYKLFDMLR